jgi:hypothetical protein
MNETIRLRPPLFRALGKNDPPASVVVAGRLCHRVDIYKHDSWAATARYQGEALDVVCKFNRVQPILGVPMRWLGRHLARREAQALQRLSGIPGIPVPCGPISVNGQILENAVAHHFIPGRPLRHRQRVAENFFPRLLETLRAVHARNIAYVDLHKRENVLVGSDGAPHLIDFQVCFGLWSPRIANNRLFSGVLGALQRMDEYNLAKHVRRCRPDQLNSLSVQLDARRPWWLELHRLVAVPLRSLRRKLLAAIKVRGQEGRAWTELFAEDALRTS